MMTRGAPPLRRPFASLGAARAVMGMGIGMNRGMNRGPVGPLRGRAPAWGGEGFVGDAGPAQAAARGRVRMARAYSAASQISLTRSCPNWRTGVSSMQAKPWAA